MSERTEKLTAAIVESLQSIRDPNNCKVPSEVYNIEGYSGKKFKRFLNTLLSKDIAQNYLEIGVWKGSTSVFGLHGNENKIKHWVVDNFCLFGGKPCREEFLANWNKHLKVQANLIEEDCFAIDKEQHQIKDVDIYFYDGEHEVSDQRKALTYYKDSMKDSFIYIVDDWSWQKVKTGTAEGFAEANLKIIEKFEFHSSNDSEGWWNGCGIFVLSK